jgi:hypothetical protein
MNMLETKPYVELFAYLAAGGFFLYKLLTGYLMTNLSASISCSRQCAYRNGKDHLIVSVNLSKGERGSVNLHDAQVKVKWNSGAEAKPLIGANRRSLKTEAVGKSERRVVNWAKQSAKQPFLRLTAGESCQFAAYFEVPCAQVCEIELAVLGMKQSGLRVGQWRASAFSLPHADDMQDAKPNNSFNRSG